MKRHAKQGASAREPVVTYWASPPVVGTPAWKSARGAPREGLRPAAPATLRRPIRARRADDGGGRRRLPRLLEEPDHGRDPDAAPATRRGLRSARPDRRDVRGDRINVSEKRPVLHVALRAPREAIIVVDGKNVVPEGTCGARPDDGLRRARARRRLEGPHRKAHPERDQTSASAARISAR